MCFQVTDLFYNTLSYILKFIGIILCALTSCFISSLILQIFNLLVLATQIGGIHPAIVEGQIKYHHI